MRQLMGLLLLIPALSSADTTVSIASPRIVAGESVELVMMVANEDTAPLTIEVPDTVHVRAETQDAVATLDLAPDVAGILTIAPNSFRKIRLRGEIPAQAIGPVLLTPTGMEANAVMVLVDAPSATTSVAAGTRRPEQQESRLIDKPPPLAVSAYEPVYFILGGDGGLNAKFQVSFRYQLFDGSGPLSQQLPWLDDLYLSFSTTSLWDLSDTSKPFTDSSYRPRLFYANYDLARVLDGQLRLGVETGFGHESNGKDGLDSRSFNMAYVRPTLTFGNPDGLRAYLAPLIHNYIAADENPDLKDYRGYVDWVFGVGSRGGLDFWATLRKGERSSYGSTELNLSYPLSKLSGGDLTGWMILQYFGGYGESLLHYQEKLDSQFRLGIAIAL